MRQIDRKTSSMMRVSLCSITVGAILLCGLSPRCFAEEKLETAEEDYREILTLAKRHELRMGPKRFPLQFQSEPVLRWPNATRKTPAGGTFIWTLDGRPEVIACIWKGGPSFAFHSLSTHPVIAQDGEKTIWRSEKPGIDFKQFADAPQPADSEGKRLSQMRALARRFHCRVTLDQKNQEELRLLPSPLYRYKTDRQKLLDGALFAFVQGTDPEVILILEARNREGQPSEWQYALSRRSMLALEARLDDQPIWSVPQSIGSASEPWFHGDFPPNKAAP